MLSPSRVRNFGSWRLSAWLTVLLLIIFFSKPAALVLLGLFLLLFLTSLFNFIHWMNSGKSRFLQPIIWLVMTLASFLLILVCLTRLFFD